MKRTLGSIDLQSILCLLLCALLLAGLFMPIVSFGGIEKVLRTMADGARYYEIEELLDAIADVLKRDDYDKELLKAFADYDWDYSASRKRSGSELEDYYNDIYDRVEAKVERQGEELLSLLWEYESELEDIFDYERYSELPSVARKLLSDPEVQEYISLYLIYLLVEVYCSMSEDAWDVVDMTEYITTIQQYARAIADRKISAVEMGRLLRTLAVAADVVVAEIGERELEETIEDIEDGYSYYYVNTSVLPILKLLNNRWILRAANIAWSAMETLYAIAVLGIAALVLLRKKKRGFALSIVVTVASGIVLIGAGVFCVAINQGLGDGLEMSGSFYLSKTLRLCSVGIGAILAPVAGAALAVLTKRQSRQTPYSAGGWTDYNGGFRPMDSGVPTPMNYGGYAPAGWTCACGNVCSDAQRFCTSCGRGRPVQQTIRRCARCGYELDADTVFCPSCGQRQ